MDTANVSPLPGTTSKSKTTEVAGEPIVSETTTTTVETAPGPITKFAKAIWTSPIPTVLAVGAVAGAVYLAREQIRKGGSAEDAAQRVGEAVNGLAKLLG